MDSLSRGRAWRERLCIKLSVKWQSSQRPPRCPNEHGCRTENAGRANVCLGMLKLNSLGAWRSPVRCCQRTLLFQRSFTLSRFPDRGAPSGGRIRPPTPTSRVRPNPDTQRPLAHDESTFNTPDSPLLEESHQRHPSSDPEDGLKRLLQNDALVVTRLVTLLFW
jgi:hypothetical protein